MPRGRPTIFKASYVSLAKTLGAQGVTKDGLAEALGVSRRTLGTWLATRPDFSSAFASGRLAGRSSLFARALGLEQTIVRSLATPRGASTVTVTERRPPEVRACMLWLRNRRPASWRH